MKHLIFIMLFISSLFASVNEDNKSIFTTEELEWIKNNPVIKIGADLDWPPFEYVDANGNYQGIASDYLQKLSKYTGLKFEVDASDWHSIITKIKEKKLDMLTCVAKTQDREEYLNYTYPYLNIDVVVIAKKELQIKKFDEIKNYTIAVQKGNFVHEKLIKEYPNIKFVFAPSNKEAFEMVSYGRADIFIGNMPVFSYFVEKELYTNIEVKFKADFEKIDLSMAVLKENKILFNIVQKVMPLIIQKEEEKINKKWIKIDYKQKIDYDLIWKILTISIIILSIIFYWNRKLKEEIKEKEKIQKELETERNNISSLNEELKKAKDIAENIAKQKSEFLANMSHEIRTPMNSIIGFTEILDKEIKNPLQKEYLESIKKGGNSLLRIINDILDLSRIEAGKLEIRNESLNPVNMFMEIESIFHSKIISKNITFIVDVDKTIPKYIIIDGVRIRQILFNLIGNAIKFTQKGNIKLKVENVYKDNIKSKIDLIFSVEDTGIGIDNNNLESIFNAFEQENNHDVAKYGGTGLGLAICTKLVHMMNGEISVKSEKNKGSIFTVILKDIPVSSMDEEIVISKLKVSNIEFEKAQILVVDDVEENRKLVQASLKDFDINLIMAQNGQEAIDKLKNINVDLILMDLRMPVMDGYEAANIIKNDSKLKKIPLIALTASVMGKDLEKVSQYGFDGYLRKPVILDDLMEELAKYLKYHLINKDIMEENRDKIIDFDKLSLVLEKLENEFKDEWINIKDAGDFSLMEIFAQKLNKLSIDEDIYLLKDYSVELIKNIDSFDIEKVDYLMNRYLELIDNLKAKIANK